MAERLFRKALEWSREDYPNGSASTLVAELGLANVMRDRGEYAEATLRYEDAVASALELRDLAMELRSRTDYGQCLLSTSRFEDAEVQLLAAYETSKGMSQNGLGWKELRFQLITLYEAWEKPDEAQKWSATYTPSSVATQSGQYDLANGN